MKKVFTKKNIFYAIIILLVLLAALLPVIIEKSKNEESADASILETTAKLTSISRTLSGTGTLTAEESYDIDIPDGVEITKYLVSEGQIVGKGDALATIDKASVLKAISSIRDSMNVLEQEMSLADGAEEESIISAKLSGTVKAMYAHDGDDVQTVMKNNGCLAVIEIENTGDNLYVSAVTGKVEKSYYAEGQHVYSGATLFYLKDVDFATEYELLAKQHKKYEDMTERLFKMYESGCLEAPCDGFVSNIDASLEVKAIKVSSAAYSGTYPRDEDFIATAQSDYSADNGMIKFTNPDGRTEDFPVQPYSGKISTNDVLMIHLHQESNDDSTYTVLYNASDPYTPAPSPSPNPNPNPTPGGNAGGMMGGGLSMGGGFSMGGGISASTEEQELYSMEETTAMNVTPMTKMTITITLDELDVLSAEVGQKAQVTIDALPGRAYEGVVTSVNTTGSNSGGNSKYTAEVTVDYDQSMLPGMNASILITISTKNNVIAVPVDALSEEENRTVVYTGYDKKKDCLLNPIAVKTGVSDGISVEIMEGLSEGQSVFYQYYDKVKIQGLPEFRR